MDIFGTFFSNIWQWFVDNKDAILTFFMSGQALSFVAAIVLLIRNIKGTKDNTKSSELLNSTLTETNNMSNSVKNLDDNFVSLKNECGSLREKLKIVEDKFLNTSDELKNKLNSIIEVQSIVYSTIRDDSVRQTVNTILNNARYSDKNFKQELEIKIEELRENYAKEIKAVNDSLTESVDKITETLTATERAKNRMKENSNIRY